MSVFEVWWRSAETEPPPKQVGMRGRIICFSKGNSFAEEAIWAATRNRWVDPHNYEPTPFDFWMPFPQPLAPTRECDFICHACKLPIEGQAKVANVGGTTAQEAEYRATKIVAAMKHHQEWQEDSSLEKWFPITAQDLMHLQNEVHNWRYEAQNQKDLKFVLRLRVSRLMVADDCSTLDELREKVKSLLDPACEQEVKDELTLKSIEIERLEGQVRELLAELATLRGGGNTVSRETGVCEVSRDATDCAPEFKCEVCGKPAAIHIQEIGYRFCQSCCDKIDARLKEIGALK